MHSKPISTGFRPTPEQAQPFSKQVKPGEVSCSGEICITWDNLGRAECSFVPVAPCPQCTDTQTHAQPDRWQGWGGQVLDQLFPRAETQLTPPHPHLSGDFAPSSRYPHTGFA